jgi:membrane protein DedA with SNARE-associated domain
MEASFRKIQTDFNEWGFWIVALKGLTPIPYKIVTIASGVAKLDMTTFIVASLIARGFRFFSLAALIYYFGPSVRDYIEENLGFVTTVAVAALVGGFVIFKYINEIGCFFSSLF